MTQSPLPDNKQSSRRKLGDLLALLGGGDLSLLERAPSKERSRLQQLGLVLLTTAGLASLSMTFFLNQAFGLPPWAGCVPGLLWGFIIINIDRLLILTMSRAQSRAGWFWTVVPRLLLAFVLSLIVATPLVLQLFNSDIQRKSGTILVQDSAKYAQEVENSVHAQRIKAAKADIDAADAIISGAKNPSASTPQIQSLQVTIRDREAQITKVSRARDQAQNRFNCERGYAGCRGKWSGVVGAGTNAAIAKQELDTKNQELIRLESQQSDDQAKLIELRSQSASAQAGDYAARNAAAVKAREEAVSRLAIAEAEQQKLVDQNSSNQLTAGFLLKLNALGQLESEDRTVLWWSLLVTFALFLIELLPVGVKTLMLNGEETIYELAEKHEAKSAEQALIHEFNAERKKRETRANVQVEIEQDMAEREAELGKHANAHVAKEMKNILNTALAKWSEELTEDLNRKSRSRPSSTNGNDDAGKAPPMPDFDSFLPDPDSLK